MKVFIIVSEVEIEAESQEEARQIVTDRLESTGLPFSFYSINEILVPSDF